jgi:glutathione S-transferase
MHYHPHPSGLETMTTLTLVSHHLCPYVQRAAIALDEKGVEFDRAYVDLGNKPAWFRAISPMGKVPLLKVEDAGANAVLFESAVILEYLEESRPNPLHPGNVMLRARHRGWMEFGSAILNAISRFYSAKTAEALRFEAENLDAMFGRVEAELAQGPWFAGARFSLVDAVYGPIFRYFDTFDRIADFGILAGKPGLAEWRTRLAGRRSVQAAVSRDYPERLWEFLLRRESALSALMPA